jgi:hypothetical protein
MRPAVIVLPKSTGATVRFCAAAGSVRLFLSYPSLNRVKVRGPCVPSPESIFQGWGLGWVHGTTETNRPFFQYLWIDLAWQRGSKTAVRVARGIAECGR